MTFEELTRDIASQKFYPVYLFMGDESYYIDQLTDLLIRQAIPDTDKDFNQTILYGSQVDVASVITLARSFPLMGTRQLIVIKEAQNLKKIDDLEVYVKKPLESTIVVLNYKNGSIDKRKKLYTLISKHGIIFESKKIPDYKISTFITSHITKKNLRIDQKSAQILTDYLGNDLNKIVNEIDKLILSLPASEKNITADLIEKNIGISKDFNNYELLKAVVGKDIFKANQIANYFSNDPKNNPLILTIAVLFNFFSNLMICYWAKDKTENGIACELGFRNTFQAKDYVIALKNYNAFKTMDIITILRTYDAKGKGVGNLSTSDGDLLKEMLYKIMH